MKRDKISDRVREQAATFCSARACVAPNQYGQSYAELLATLGASQQVSVLASRAWEHVQHHLDWPDDYIEDYYWAEAESLIRTGWEPQDWRNR